MDGVEPQAGTTVKIAWGVGQVKGRVVEAYGPAHARRIVVELTPELSDHVVGERTTVVLPRSAVHAAA